MPPNGKWIPLCVAELFLACVVVIELISIYMLNNGIFIYTLDDPYIHMALAEHIRLGHYGVNFQEFSSPSSSIIWPFILSFLPSHHLVPLFLNIICASLTVFFYYKCVRLSLYRNNSILFQTTLLVLLIVGSNIVGLIFTGMEHSMQLFFVALTAYGLIWAVETKKVAKCLIFAIIVAPLIRYENLAISLSAIAFLLLEKHYKQSLVALICVFLFVSSFSLFLVKLGLPPMPSSVMAKSNLVGAGGLVLSVIGNVINSLYNNRGMLLFISIGIFIYGVIFGDKSKSKTNLAIAIIGATLLHLMAGQYGWYSRYEIYIWAFILINLLYFWGDSFEALLGAKENRESVKHLAFVLSFFVVFLCLPYIEVLFNTPIASNNIYEQQYQMHRFASNYYKKPVAVNDLGLVAYKNDNYVLDLWGLAYPDALFKRQSNIDPDWMALLADKKGTDLIMIYDDWFRALPDQWVPVGRLFLGKKRITPAREYVTFYARNISAYSDIKSKLDDFIPSLPQGCSFILFRN